jgi:hypothetical protein
MNDKRQAREIDVRRAIMKLELKAVAKLTLLGILDCVDWSTMSGQVSSTQVSEHLNHPRRSIVRAFVQLEELDLISRSSYWVKENRKSIASTKINVDYIFQLSATMAQCVTMAQDEPPWLKSSATMAQGVVSPCHSINKNNYNNLTQLNSATMALPKRKRLTGEQIKAIETECIRIGDTSHRSRVDVASKLFNIKLIKGGYYV